MSLELLLGLLKYLSLHASNKKSYQSYYISRMRLLLKFFGKKRVLDVNGNSFLIEKYERKKPDVNFQKGFLVARDTKNGEDRIIPMDSLLTETLIEVIKNAIRKH